MLDNEQPGYWIGFPHDDLALRVAVLHAQRRQTEQTLAQARQAVIDAQDAEIATVRRTVAALVLRGRGIEVGAGSRPFPLPDGVTCHYGDVRDHAELATYFGTSSVTGGARIDAQTMAGIPPGSADFVISAHVIEHLLDPLGSIEATMRVLRLGGAMVLVAPELSNTWDRLRPPTTLEHAIADSRDGGESTRLQAYLEHARYVHPQITGTEIPEDLLEADARATMASGMDIHVHAWRAVDMRELLDYAAPRFRFEVEAQIESFNENIFVLRRLG